MTPMQLVEWVAAIAVCALMTLGVAFLVGAAAMTAWHAWKIERDQ